MSLNRIEDRALRTHEAAMSLIEAEKKAIEIKTAKLRALRLASEQQQALNAEQPATAAKPLKPAPRRAAAVTKTRTVAKTRTAMPGKPKMPAKPRKAVAKAK